MRAVNLLPSQYRPRKATGGLSGSAYAVTGVLAVLLLAATAYVLTANQADSKAAKAATATQEAKAAETRAAELGNFGNFATIKQTRQASVAGLAQVRFDWERFLRELALLLPPGTTVSEADAALVAEAEAGKTASPSAPSGPTADLKGCARTQNDVARLMVRLREMHRVEVVTLKESTFKEGSAGAADSAATPVAQGTKATCNGAYEYQATVAFKATKTSSEVPTGNKRVPVSLGGGE